jgi:acetamidase/formamidase
MTILTAGGAPASSAHYLSCSPDTVLWGTLPTPKARPLLDVDSGETITFDTITQEGMMEDQGRDPVAYFGAHAVSRKEILRETIEIAESDLRRDPATRQGPHIVLGPVRVRGADVGDWLKVEFLALQPRVPYGVISSRHQRGTLPHEFPRSENGAALDVFSRFCRITDAGDYAIFDYGSGRAAIEMRPFMGLCGVTPNSELPLSTIPPGSFGGNIDLREIVAGTTLFLRVQVPGAGFYLGDPHFAQGNGEIALTALEGSLRATVRLSVIRASPANRFLLDAQYPFAETDTHWVILGLHEDLDEAMRRCARIAVTFVAEQTGMSTNEAYLYLSAAADFSVTQVVDIVKGVHCTIRKRDL